MKNYIKGLITGMTVSFCVVILSGAGEKNSTNELLEKIQQDISNIESDVYRMSEKGVECLGAVRCGGGFVDRIVEEVNCQ
jgi:hypothetical protein|tara:strand:+ start:311 stop:550 length:240 start_codon:yes stop_codon:yes gene_type:complete